MAAAVQIIRSVASAEKLLKPERIRILEALGDGGSSTTVARQMDLPRQTVNYHLRELEKEGFVELVEERRNRNCMERIVRPSARAYVIAPSALRQLGGDAGPIRDQFSSAYLIAAAARTIEETAALRQRADRAGKRLATLTIETEVRLANAAARQQFTQELTEAVERVAARYHDETVEGGRSYRVLLAAHPKLNNSQPADESSVRME